MNLLEHYIEEVISVKPCNEEWTLEFEGVKFYDVELISDCYGRKERDTHIWRKSQMEQILQQGFYMA